ncbi:hypothetical protein [Polyangium sp. 6x1]|uniref:hypothetical protein n=1 Tax=Polyangium sp. 6x1 TaxID=3042689 RepID=UPI002482A9FD|nr:hypothetical protein [Polyangium sp. 6x1]MDI1448047.1 hypothetical protein [Polyangium sp. 6x1]
MASATGTEKFLAQGPVAFARTHPIVPDGGLALNDADVAEHFPGEKRHEIKVPHRLRMATITKNHNATSDKNLAYLLTHQRYRPGHPIAADSFLTWYLPWNPGGGQVNMSIPIDPVLGPEGGPENVNPPFFFTAELTGCSVFVRGDPRAPEIFHAGAQNPSWQGSAGTHWRTLFAKSRPLTFEQDRFVEVNKYDYIGGDVLGARYTPPLVKAYVERIEAEEKLRDANCEILGFAGFGCVFGHRDTIGHWAFYLQENVRIFYRRPATPKPYACANRALRLSQIYPHRAVVATNDAPKPLPFP